MVYGRAGSGKSQFCYDEIRARLDEGNGKPLILIVPEQYTFQAERSLVKAVDTGGIMKVEVLSFRRMSYRVFNEVGGITYPHIHSAGKCMIIYRILDRMKDSFKVFSRSADRQGFVNSISSMITEFKRYNITPGDLNEACGRLTENELVKAKLSELVSIYTEFEEAIKERYRDSDDDLAQLSRKLEHTSMYDGAEVWIDGFSGFTPQEYDVVGKLLKKAERVTICLCADCSEEEAGSDCGGNDVFSPVRSAARRIVEIAREYGVKAEAPVYLEEKLLPRFKESSELCHLERNFFACPYSVYRGKTHDISLFSSANMYSEIEETARDIVRLCREKGLRYRDIGVFVRNLEAYGRLLEAIFKEYEIPVFIDRKVDITNHPLVRLILSMLDIFAENWSYESVFRYLKTGLTGIDRSSIDQLENYVLACGIRGNRWTSDGEWSMIPEIIPDDGDSGNQRELLEEINRIRLEVTRPLLQFREKTKGRRKASEICSSLYEFLCEIGVPERIEGFIDLFRSSGKLNLASEYSQVWNIVMEVFDQAVEVMGEETLGLDRFSCILAIGLGEYKAGLIPASLDQVLAGSIERSRSHEVKALYILGVNDGVFPSAAMEEGILSDADRERLKDAGIELASDTRTRAFEEQYLVYRALTTAGRYLRLSWPAADHEGRAMRPSIIISRIKRIFPEITQGSDIVKNDSDSREMELLTGREPAFRHMIDAIRQKADGKDVKPLWHDVYRWFLAREDWYDRCRRLRSAFLYRNVPEPVSREKIAELYGSPVQSSVSRLEKYTACPFAYFVQYGLGAKERKVYRLSPPDVGTFMHAAIERFSLMVSEQGLSWSDFDREWCKSTVSAIVDDMLDKMRGSGLSASKRYTALALRLKRVITRAVWLIAEHMRRSGFIPVGYELGFGEGESFPPIVIELESGEKVHLTGRIDRVDALRTDEGTYLRIVDYKSGSKAFKLSDVFYGLQIQLITYLDAIWENGFASAEPPVLPGGVLYFRIEDPIVRGNSKATAEEIERAIMRQLKMKGLLLADVKLIREMDRTIDGDSLIIPARINKGDLLGRSSAASLDQFNALRAYVRSLIKSLCGEILKGSVSIKPYKKKGMTACKYCSFSVVCQFDTSLGHNTFKVLRDRDDEEVWSLMAESSGRGGEQ